MLLWLNGTSTTGWDVNENYARELQELFCLGAGRGYSERDVRQLARALTGFRNDWTDAGPTRFRYDSKFHDPRAKKIYGQRGKLRLAGGRAAGHAPPPPPRVHGRQALGLLHPDQADAGDGRRRWRGSTSPSGREVRPLLEAILAHPDLYDAGQADGQAAGRPGRGHAARRRPRDRHARLGVAVRQRRPVPLPAAQRLRLGRHALAGHRDLPRALADGAVHLRARRGSIPRRGDRRARRSRRAGPPRGRLLGLARALRARCARAWSATPPTPWPPPPSPGRRRATPCWRSTRCGCWSPPPPTT